MAILTRTSFCHCDIILKGYFHALFGVKPYMQTHREEKKKHYKNKETRCQLSSDRGKYTYIATNKSSARWTHLAPVTVFAIGQQNKRNSLALTQKTYVLLRNHSDFDSPIFYSVELTRTQTNQNQTQGGPRILTGLLGLFRIHVIADTIILAESWDQIPLMS